MMKAFLRSCALLTLTAAAFAQQSSSALFDSDTISGLGARNIGPAVTGGRVAAMDGVHEGNRITIYVGSAGGGVWKSVNGGTTFKPIFDKYNQSIGAVTVDPNHPKTVWVGTGESWMRNTVSVGSGIYRTTDGGDNWDFMGLPDSEHISRIIVNPKDSNTVYACALGHAWNDNEERGVFKTTDGGKTWTKVLYIAPDTGCAMIAMDAQNPDTLYAGMWQYRRTPYSFTSGGPKSALLKTTDGGKTWKPMRNGIETGDLGRIGLATSPAKSGVVYAVVEAKETALYRSDDGGENWLKQNTGFNVQGRPFYFANLFTDPKDPMRVYKPGFGLGASEDGGKTFTGIGGSVHGDYHAMWIDSANPETVYVGDDGGVYKSEDRGNSFRFLSVLPIGQFYHVSYDMEDPYNLYGGLQDNGTWMGPSANMDGIANRHWQNIDGGDGFWAWSDPADPAYAYAEYQGGHLARVNKITGETKNIAPFPAAGEKKLRFNWNAPVVPSPNHKGRMYLGAQFLFASDDHGESWQRISGDLTTNDPAEQQQEKSGGLTVDNSDAETHDTIYAISESPKDGNIIWVGTDDGNVQLTRDGGKTWTNLTANLTGLPKKAWVSFVDASPFDPATAFATFDAHTLGDMKSYVYKTSDFGKTWTPLATKDVSGYAHVVRQDTVNKDLIFLGTENGLFISLDGGANWAQFKGGNFPGVAVRDVAVHPRTNDLLIATHGRSLWIVDDITPLRALTPEVLQQDAAFLPSNPQLLTIPAGSQRFDGDAEFIGRSSPEEAVITYYQKKRHIFGDMKFEIFDEKGTLLSTIPGDKRRGVNRIRWSMRSKPPKVPPAAALVQNYFSFVGPRVEQGTYTVKLTKGKQTYTGKLNIVPDPRSKHSAEDRAAQHQLVTKLYNDLGHLTQVVDIITDAYNQAKDRSAKLSANDATKKRVDALVAKISDIRSKLVATKEGGQITGELRVRENMGGLYGDVNGYDGRPTQSQVDRAAALEKETDAAAAEFDQLATKELPAVNTLLQKKKLDPIKPMTKQEWDAKEAKESAANFDHRLNEQEMEASGRDLY